MCFVIKAVSFDLWFTVLTTTFDRDRETNRLRQEKIHAILRSHGYPKSLASFSADYEVINRDLNREIIANGFHDMAIEERIRRFLVQILQRSPLRAQFERDQRGLEALIGEIIPPFTQSSLALKPLLVNGIKRALDYVKREGWKIGMISNTEKTPGKVLRQILADYQILDYFDALIFSDEVCLSKPHPQIFMKLCEQLDIRPANLIHIGDSVEADIVGSRNVGAQGVLYLGMLRDSVYYHPTLLDQLKKYNPAYIIDNYVDLPQALDAVCTRQPFTPKLSPVTLGLMQKH